MVSTLRGLNINAGYGSMNIVHDVSFEVSEGEVVAVVGPNGSGKSTLIKSVFGLCDVHSGQLVLDNQNLRATSGYKISGLGLSYVPQTANVFTNLSIKENLELGLPAGRGNEIGNRIKELSKLFPILNERNVQLAGSLSGGERQMVAIARALMAKPKIIMLDEPTAMLSPKYVGEIFKIIAEMRGQGIGILLVEQNARKALELSDRAYVMIQGHVEFTGSGHEILSNENVENMYLGRSKANREKNQNKETVQAG